MTTATTRKKTCTTWLRFGALPALLAGLLLPLTGCMTPPPSQEEARPVIVPKWQTLNASLQSSRIYENPFQQAELTVTLISPLGESYRIPGFWNGGSEWRFRFAPDLIGNWYFTTSCSDTNNSGLHNRSGQFTCTAPSGTNVFYRKGHLKLSRDRHYLVHDDNTPFFWLADTTWNGALKSTPGEWDRYIAKRKEQKFNAVQWVTTQWRAAPDGDIDGRQAYVGEESITPNVEFFKRLDEKAKQLAESGMLNVPVLLWAIGGGSDPSVNPGFSLPEDQAIKLARYMVARWQGYPVVWILGGDGDFRGEKAERWKRIGRAVFGDIHHAPTMMHPGGMQWNLPEFQNEEWLDIIGYQSGHGDSDSTLRWIYQGPPSNDWQKKPARPFINLEPPYENHIAYQSGKPHTGETVRRMLYWSLLNAPTAGVSYGGHGVWGWDDGTGQPVDHNNSGVPLPWEEALTMEAASQMPHLHSFFTGIEFWKLRPAESMLARQPGNESPDRHISIARSTDNQFAVAYIPKDRNVEIKLSAMPPRPQISWFNPRTGKTNPAVGVVVGDSLQVPTPSEGDWLLHIRAGSTNL